MKKNLKTYLRIWKLGTKDKEVLEREQGEKESIASFITNSKFSFRKDAAPGRYKIDLEFESQEGPPREYCYGEFLVLKEENQFIRELFSETELLKLHELEVLDAIIKALKEDDEK